MSTISNSIPNHQKIYFHRLPNVQFNILSPKPLRNTVKFAFVFDDGKEVPVEGNVGENLLQIAHRMKLPMEGACEGVCACSTCHVILEESVFDSLEEASEEEDDMLDLAPGLEMTSRLGCQVEVNESMQDMKVRLPKITRNFYVDGHVPEPH